MSPLQSHCQLASQLTDIPEPPTQQPQLRFNLVRLLSCLLILSLFCAFLFFQVTSIDQTWTASSYHFAQNQDGLVNQFSEQDSIGRAYLVKIALDEQHSPHCREIAVSKLETVKPRLPSGLALKFLQTQSDRARILGIALAADKKVKLPNLDHINLMPSDELARCQYLRHLGRLSISSAVRIACRQAQDPRPPIRLAALRFLTELSPDQRQLIDQNTISVLEDTVNNESNLANQLEFIKRISGRSIAEFVAQYMKRPLRSGERTVYNLLLQAAVIGRYVELNSDDTERIKAIETDIALVSERLIFYLEQELSKAVKTEDPSNSHFDIGRPKTRRMVSQTFESLMFSVALSQTKHVVAALNLMLKSPHVFKFNQNQCGAKSTALLLEHSQNNHIRLTFLDRLRVQAAIWVLTQHSFASLQHLYPKHRWLKLGVKVKSELKSSPTLNCYGLWLELIDRQSASLDKTQISNALANDKQVWAERFQGNTSTNRLAKNLQRKLSLLVKATAPNSAQSKAAEVPSFAK